MNNLTGKWIPPNERSKFITSYLGSSIGVATAYPMFGFIIKVSSWEWVFHACGIAGSIWCICWLYFVSWTIHFVIKFATFSLQKGLRLAGNPPKNPRRRKKLHSEVARIVGYEKGRHSARRSVESDFDITTGLAELVGSVGRNLGPLHPHDTSADLLPIHSRLGHRNDWNFIGTSAFVARHFIVAILDGRRSSFVE